ncbi:MAG TPA: hypothetical protein VKQ70_15160 [Caulobacteraceae bacterium]|nr:hypothetical protein [Caulobacteraceae bacterium]
MTEGGSARRPRVLLARELCSFEWFEPVGGRAAADQAARLYARASAPFNNPGVLVRRGGGGYGIWWWDRERVGPWLAERFGPEPPAVAPETLAQPLGAAWRVVRLASGFELQHWRRQTLVASSWRRAAPDAAAWAAFTRQQRDPETAPPDDPPAPQSLPVIQDADFGGGWRDVSLAETARLALGGFAALLAVMSLFWAGQALRLGQLSAALERQALAESTAAPPPHANVGARRQVAAYQALGQRPDPMAGLKTALDVLRRHGLAAKAFSVDGPTLTVTVPYAALGQMGEVTQELRATGAFSDVRPLSNSVDGTIELRLDLTKA